MEEVEVHALHGFLGRPADWEVLAREVPALKPVDIFRVATPAAGASMADWAKVFNTTVASTSRRPRVLLGYSMGGRLALHAIAQAPPLWDAAVIVSAHPGLPNAALAERQTRLKNDDRWARRFENESWESVTAAWEDQPVFGGRSRAFRREETDFRRADLAGALRAWSLGQQVDLSEQITRLKLAQLWVAGADDARYVQVAEKMAKLHEQAGSAESPPWQSHVLPSAGHRAPWDQPAAFAELFCGFLSRIRIQARQIDTR